MSVQPSNGVFFDFDLNAAARTVTVASGASMVMSAGAPSVSVPPGSPSVRAGLTDSSSTSRGETDHAGVHEPIEAERHGRLESDDAERRAVELERLLVGVMRRVVGGDDVDRPVAQALDHRVAVGLLAQRRVHLQVRVVAAALVQRLVGQDEVMRRHLGRDRDAAVLAGAHRAQRLARAHVRDVDAAAGHLGQRDVALDHDRLGDAGNPLQPEQAGDRAFVRDAVALERRILAVVDDRHAEHRRVFERPPHQQRRRDRPAVVGDRDAAGGAQVADLGQLLALRSRSRRRQSDTPARARLPPRA